MRNIALSDAGVKLSQATSHHSDFPPTNIIDKNISKPWITTGMFPQYFMLSFPDLMQIQSIKIVAKKVKEILVERSSSIKLENFEEVVEKTLPKSDQTVAELLSNEELTAHHLKITIKSGYDHFVSIFDVEIMGNLASGQSPTMIRKTASARSSKKFRNGIEPEVVEEEEPEDLDGSFKRRRFQSAFRVPNSNRTSIVENTNDTLVDRNDDDDAFEINQSGMMYDNSDDEDNDSEDEYMRQNY